MQCIALYHWNLMILAGCLTGTTLWHCWHILTEHMSTDFARLECTCVHVLWTMTQRISKLEQPGSMHLR